MNALFKDKDKLIINSLNRSECIAGEVFVDNAETSNVVLEPRKDVNDDFDGLVIKLTPKEPIPDYEDSEDMYF